MHTEDKTTIEYEYEQQKDECTFQPQINKRGSFKGSFTSKLSRTSQKTKSNRTSRPPSPQLEKTYIQNTVDEISLLKERAVEESKMFQQEGSQGHQSSVEHDRTFEPDPRDNHHIKHMEEEEEEKEVIND